MARKNQSTVTGFETGNKPENTGIGNEIPSDETIHNETNGGSNPANTTDTTGNTATAGKRKRGRPLGSTNKAKNQETIFVQDQIKHDNKKSSKDKSSKFLSTEDATQLSKTIIETAEFLAINFVSVDAKMLNTERLLLEFSLPNYLQTIELSAVEKASNLLYPLAAITGAAMYAIRVAGLASEKYRNRAKAKLENEPLTETPTNYQQDSYEPRKASMNGEVDWSNKQQFPIRGY